MAQISEAALFKKFRTSQHRHFCSDRNCRRSYQCQAVIYLHDGCPEPRQNARCAQCRGGAESRMYAGWEPRECCRNNVAQVTNRDELLSYKLGGSGPWFKCKTCARCTGWPQGYRPDTTGGSNG